MTTNGTISPELRAKLALSEARGAFQGWIGDYIVYQRDGQTFGYRSDNKTAEPDYTGSEEGLYALTGRTPYPTRSRF